MSVNNQFRVELSFRPGQGSSLFQTEIAFFNFNLRRFRQIKVHSLRKKVFVNFAIIIKNYHRDNRRPGVGGNNSRKKHTIIINLSSESREAEQRVEGKLKIKNNENAFQSLKSQGRGGKGKVVINF